MFPKPWRGSDYSGRRDDRIPEKWGLSSVGALPSDRVPWVLQVRRVLQHLEQAIREPDNVTRDEHGYSYVRCTMFFERRLYPQTKQYLRSCRIYVKAHQCWESASYLLLLKVSTAAELELYNALSLWGEVESKKWM